MIGIAVGVASAALLIAIVLALQLSQVRKRVDSVPQDGNVITLLKGVDNELARLESIVGALEPRLAVVERHLPRAITNTGVVSYDAFGDIAGNMSRTVALLSDRGDGVVFSILVGRNDAHVFTKEVRGFDGVEELSPEEKAAVLRAGGGSL